MARRCGAKRICNSKSWTTDGLGPFLEVRMWKNGTVMRRSAFASQNAQSTTFLDHYWVLRCSKMARRCGAKRICNSKSWTTDGLGPFLEVRMWKNGTVMRRSAFASQNAQSTTFLDHYWVLRCSKMARRCGAKHHLHVTMLSRTVSEFIRPALRRPYGPNERKRNQPKSSNGRDHPCKA